MTKLSLAFLFLFSFFKLLFAFSGQETVKPPEVYIMATFRNLFSAFQSLADDTKLLVARRTLFEIQLDFEYDFQARLDNERLFAQAAFEAVLYIYEAQIHRVADEDLETFSRLLRQAHELNDRLQEAYLRSNKVLNMISRPMDILPLALLQLMKMISMSRGLLLVIILVLLLPFASR